MTGITHHIPDNLLIAYAAGTLPGPFALVVAAHVSLCDECRARLAAHEAAGGAIIEQSAAAPISADLRDRVLGALDDPFNDSSDMPAPQARQGIYPGPVMEALRGRSPRWKRLGMGNRQCIIDHGAEGSVRLLWIAPGQAVPDHGHNGLELTLVLQGTFEDETGRFGAGDVEVANADLEHTPVAAEGAPCICLAATDAALKFNSFVPRVLQPIFRI